MLIMVMIIPYIFEALEEYKVTTSKIISLIKIFQNIENRVNAIENGHKSLKLKRA